jgi:hypothetical protein
VLNIAIEGVVREAQPDEFLIDLINRAGGSVPQVCYHPARTCSVHISRCGPATSLRRHDCAGSFQRVRNTLTREGITRSISRGAQRSVVR